jgi:hypothetical protein
MGNSFFEALFRLPRLRMRRLVVFLIWGLVLTCKQEQVQYTVGLFAELST